MADPKDTKDTTPPPAPPPPAAPKERSAAHATHFVVMHDGMTLADGFATKNEVVERDRLGDAARVAAVTKLGAVRPATAGEAKLERVTNEPEPGVTVEQLDAQIEALEEQKKALLDAAKAKK